MKNSLKQKILFIFLIKNKYETKTFQKYFTQNYYISEESNIFATRI